MYAVESDRSTPAGSIAWGNGTTSHPYCACALRYPVVVNGEATAAWFKGIGTY